MKKLIMLAMAAMALVAFAIPATASADEFTHEGNEIGEAGVEAEFEGAAGFVIAAAPTEGWHCNFFVLTKKFTRTTSHIKGFHFFTCTTTSATAAKNNLVADGILVAPGHIVVHAPTRTLTITGLHFRIIITVGGTVVGENTLKNGTITALVPNGQEGAIETVSLSDEGLKVESPPGSGELDANISGDLTSNGTIGIQ